MSNAFGKTVLNENGGAQSELDIRLDLIPPSVLEEVGHTLWYGAKKYKQDNWKLIPSEDHLSHALYHLNAYQKGDTLENHLIHAIVRLMFCRVMEGKNTKTLLLNNGNEALIDDDMYNLVKSHNWWCHHTNYAVTKINGKQVSLHRYLMSNWGLLDIENSKQRIDHVNRNRLDCRRENLRLVTNDLNTHNRPHSTTSASKYRGVYWHTQCGKWYGQLRYNKKCYYLGLSSDEEELARKYDEKALEIWGDSAQLNFPTTKEEEEENYSISATSPSDPETTQKILSIFGLEEDPTPPMTMGDFFGEDNDKEYPIIQTEDKVMNVGLGDK